MMDQQGRSPESPSSGGTPRRAVVRGAAWSIPVIAAAVAAPQSAASGAGIDAAAWAEADFIDGGLRTRLGGGVVAGPSSGGDIPAGVLLTLTLDVTLVRENTIPVAGVVVDPRLKLTSTVPQTITSTEVFTLTATTVAPLIVGAPPAAVSLTAGPSTALNAAHAVALISNVPGDTDPSNDTAEESVGLA
ncbi:hypothetical protein QFZ52_002806 [Arthrobacter woluwensis]|uniref:hypothetical protein n=1 Tax=Arthrobacter woluwensis TaxID=156980 RepID=UPI0027851D2B|nr:hypothetical protein [Arthrobacter woluwensis]MDQ0710154.1 hypothetical protein [Arthrobacter woluwensis]